MPENASDDGKFAAYYTIGTQYDGLGQLDKARDAYLEAEKYQPERYSVYMSLYNVYLEMQDFGNAKLVIEKELKRDEADPEVWRQYIALQKERFNASEAGMDALYNMALKATGNSPTIMALYSEFLEGLGDNSRAISYLEKAKKANPDGKDLYDREIVRLKQK